MKNIYLLSIFLLTYLTSSAQFAGGDGSSSNPYQVSTPEQLSEVRNHLTNYFIQINNIDLKNYDHDNDGKGWMPISGAGTGQQFQGHYDGQNFVIYNLFIDRPGIANIGLFGHMGVSDDVTDIEIINLGLIGVDIDGGRGTGALVGRVTANALTKVEHCFVRYGSVMGDGAVGGLVGSNNSYRSTANSDGYKPEISKSFANVDVYWSQRVTAIPGSKFGGLAGCTQKGRIINSYARGTVNVDNRTAQISSIERVGGLVGCGLQRGEILYSYSSSEVFVPVSNPSVTNVGGLVGTADGNTVVTSGYWDIQTSGWITSPAGRGESTSDMNTQSTFVDYDFTNIWGIDPTINNGYPYLKANGGGVLPVELVFLDSKKVDNGIHIQWATATEKNNDHFMIERSNDGINFYPIDKIYGAGDSQILIHYSYTDKNPGSGTNYYRLKQIDYDGSFEFSPIISENYMSKQMVDVYPNPVETFANIRSNQHIDYYVITNLKGQTLQSDMVNGYNKSINLESLPSGIYQMSLYFENDKPLNIKIIKK